MSNRLVLCVIYCMVVFSCKPINAYDDTRLVKFLSEELNYTARKRMSLVILILQNENCICTDENVKFALDVFCSNSYENHKKLLLLKSNNHKILLNKELDLKDVEIFINDQQVLEKYGLYFATDRIFVYQLGELKTRDLHMGSIDKLRNTFL